MKCSEQQKMTCNKIAFDTFHWESFIDWATYNNMHIIAQCTVIILWNFIVSFWCTDFIVCDINFNFHHINPRERARRIWKLCLKPFCVIGVFDFGKPEKSKSSYLNYYIHFRNDEENATENRNRQKVNRKWNRSKAQSKLIISINNE